MPDIDLEPHEFRQRGKPRMWSRKTVVQFAVTVLVFEALVVWVILGRPDLVTGQQLMVVAIITWPPLFLLGVAIGYLAPTFFFEDDERR